ncbi:MAG: CDP-diacylglycerol--glycerol-3-phosphate 3-phosphatidyltransferase, partial [Lautropia sp.]|nr:CDP-diacylglycerol--glycerol-3-phosphate 3-phosphatidyltransferase [Lautropia sp.]
WMGKVKTAVQMVAIPMLLYHQTLFDRIDSQYWGSWMIAIAAALTFISMVWYLRQAWPQLSGRSGA